MKQQTLKTSCGPRGFTLVELLVTISIFVLMLGLAVPVFRTLTGSRSIESATNTVSAMLNRVRMEAIGRQECRGVMFYLDPNTGRVGMITLIPTDPPPADRRPNAIFSMGWPSLDTADTWFDLDTSSEPVLLPVGTGLQCVLDGPSAGGVRTGNGYIGYQYSYKFTGTPFPYKVRPGGFVGFDANGRLLTGYCGMVWWRYDGSVGPVINHATDLGNFLFNSPPFYPDGSSWASSQLGFCLFQSDPYLNLPHPTGFDAWEDETTAYSTNEKPKEDWLDANATPFLINRYNGTLIKGE